VAILEYNLHIRPDMAVQIFLAVLYKAVNGEKRSISNEQVVVL
jgi:hypothetical protein